MAQRVQTLQHYALSFLWQMPGLPDRNCAVAKCQPTRPHMFNVWGQRCRLSDWLLTTAATNQVWRACFLACRSRCVELITRTHPCWTWHSCFLENCWTHIFVTELSAYTGILVSNMRLNKCTGWWYWWRVMRTCAVFKNTHFTFLFLKKCLFFG